MTFITVMCGCKVGLGQHDYDLGGNDYSKIKRVRILSTRLTTSANTLTGSYDIPDTLLRQPNLHQKQHLRGTHTTCHIQTLTVHALRNSDSQRQLWCHRNVDGIVAMQTTESDVGPSCRLLLKWEHHHEHLVVCHSVLDHH
jgi:hypothetical protein